MAYVGTPIDTTNQFQSLQGKRFSGDASTTAFTLDIAPSSVFDIEVFVENVRQDPNSAYSLNGTTLTFSAAPPSGTNNIYVIHQAKAVGTINPPTGSITNDTLSSGSFSNITGTGTLTNFTSTGIDDNADATAITIDSSERVLKGHTGSITTAGKASAVQITGTTADTASLSIMRFNSSGGSSELILGQSRDSSIGGNTIVQNADNIGMIRFVADDGTDYDSTVGGIRCDIDAAPGANDTAGRLRFFTTADGSNSTTERMRIASDGQIMINTTQDLGNSQGVLHVKGKTTNNIARFGAGSNGEEIVFVNSGDTQVGSIAVNASSTSYNTSSDYRLKENVIDLDNAITKVKQLQPKRFNFISEADTTMDGFLAHEVSSIVPEAVKGTHNEVEVWKENEKLPEGVSVGDNKLDDEGNTIPKYQGIDQSKLVPLLTASLQEAIAKIETLETEMTALKARVTTLEE